MQRTIDNNKYKIFNFYNSQISNPWTNRHGDIMVSISLPKYIKENLGIDVDTSAKFNVSQSRVYQSKYNIKMNYTSIAVDREINVYVSHKEENGDYSNVVKKITGQQLYDAMKKYKPKEDPSKATAPANNTFTKVEEPSITMENIQENIQKIQENYPDNQQIQTEINTETQKKEDTINLVEEVENSYDIELDDIQF